MKTWLHLMTAILLLAAVGSLFGCLFWPFAEPTTEENQPKSRASIHHGVQSPPPVPTLEEFAKVWHKPLRRPLQDPKPKKTNVAKRIHKKPLPLNIKLIATIIDPQNPLAMIMVSNKDVQVKGIGELLDGTPEKAEVRSIQSDRVVVRYRGQDIPCVSDEKRRK